MHTLIKLWTAAALSCGLAAAAAAHEWEGDATASTTQAPGTSIPAAKAGARLLVKLGDTVKVTVYELTDAGDTPEADGSATAASLGSYFQRVDLSGEYAVQEDGNLALPRLGPVEASGRAVDEVRESIGHAFSKVMGRPADISLTIIKRRPVYVVGAVKASGAYEFVPGMMVIQAISLAGGIDRGAARSAQLIDQLRGNEKLDQTRDRLKRLLVKAARLEADSKGDAVVAVPARLTELAGHGDAKRLADGETDILSGMRRVRAAQRQDIDEQIASAERQLDLLRQRASQYDAQLQARSSRLGQLQDLQQRGGVVQTSLILAQSDLADIEGRKQDFELTFAQTEQRLQAARSSRSKLDIDEKVAQAREISDTAADIAEAERALLADAAAARTLAIAAIQEGAVDASVSPTIEIIRRDDASRSTFPAEDTTELEPGDVVKVRFASTTAAPTADAGRP